ncbi:hypothetical protein ACFFX0_01525 [Citricoccus parietis]|uniref:Uncharacterized protein n=1 Tax=Citricoccus parietis TaxID=592307 RepID=A0ABV5FUJ8_9MICC
MDDASRGAQPAGDEVHQGGLAGAIGPDDAHGLTLADYQGQGLQGLNAGGPHALHAPGPPHARRLVAGRPRPDGIGQPGAVDDHEWISQDDRGSCGRGGSLLRCGGVWSFTHCSRP